MTAFTQEARKRCKAAAVANANEAKFGKAQPSFAVDNNTMSTTQYYCLSCQDTIRTSRSSKKGATKNARTTATSAISRAPKKNKPVSTTMMPDSVRKELRRAASFYCRSQVFAGDATSADNCKVLISKNFYGDKINHKLGAVDMLIQGAGPFKELYDEYDGEHGRERVLKPWLCGVDSPVNYVPGVHFTAETIASVGKTGERKASGTTLWRESLETVKVGKKAISFVSNLDMCDYDPSTFAVTGLKSGHSMLEVYEEINNLTLAWTVEEATRLINTKKVASDEFGVDDVNASNDGDDSGIDKRFPGFFAFYLFGPTRQGSSYYSLWRRSEDAINDSGGTTQPGPVDGNGKKAQSKRKATEQEAEHKKRKEAEAVYREFRMKFEVATVAQTKDELMAQRFDLEMARISKLIDTETATAELKMTRQDRCKDQARCAQYEAEIDGHFDSIEKYREELTNLKHSTQQSQKHVDELLGKDSTSEEQAAPGNSNDN